nr:unnamed protein product [Spirometra erinaceieuropaei]
MRCNVVPVQLFGILLPLINVYLGLHAIPFCSATDAFTNLTSDFSIIQGKQSSIGEIEEWTRSCRSLPDHRMDIVRLKLQGFVFEVTSVRKVEEDTYIKRKIAKLTKAYNHLLLDAQYTSKMITVFHPLSIQSNICKLFQSLRPQDHAVTSILVINDFGAMVDRPIHDRLLHLFFQITSSLGLPTITWMPNRIGDFELEDAHLAVRLEPLTWHVARALVDFLKAFSWNIALVVYNTNIPGSQLLVNELKYLQEERNTQDHPNHFHFEIENLLPFEGLTMKTLINCTKLLPDDRVTCVGTLLNVLKRIWESVGRIIIFNGTPYDLNALLYLAQTLKGTEHEYLLEVFGEGYVWIFTPSTMALLTIADENQKQNARGTILLSEFTVFEKIPGMFGLICLNDNSNRRKFSALAVEIWYRSLMELIKQMTEIFPHTKPLSFSPVTADTLVYYRDLLEKLRPNNLCEVNERMGWKWGHRLNAIMRNLQLTLDDEPVSFLSNGGLNVSKLLILNSRTTTEKMDWFKVGTWSMSSKWGRTKSRLWLDGVTWPGGANSPPIGRSRNMKLRVAMLQEKPFLIYGKLQDDGTCDANSIRCWLNDPLGDIRTGSKLEAQNRSDVLRRKLNASTQGFPGSPDVTSGRYPACCTGLTMDLLLEIMKDLNVDVYLYEVQDKFWGVWTPDGWNGLVHELLEHKADMVVTSMKITPNRSEQIDFSVPFLETGIAITVALREGAISPTAFLEPYDYQCWCIILVFSVHASGAAIYLYEWLSPKGLDRGRLVTPERRFTLFRSLWLIWSMLFGAAVNADNPRGMASRFMANIWALFALVFLASYTANLAAFMISKDDFYDLNGINDWRLQQPWNHKPPFRFATVPNGATEENIKINFPEMAAYMRTFNRTTVIEGLKSLKAGEIDAFIYDATVLDYWTSHDDTCRLKTVGNLYAMTGYGIAFPKGSRWLQKVNARILDYEKNGKFQRWKQFWLSGVCKKVNLLGNTNKTLGVKNFISAFILLLCGMILCAVIFVLEHLLYRIIWPRLRASRHKACCNPESNVAPTFKYEEEDRQEEEQKNTPPIDNTEHPDDCTNPHCTSRRIRQEQEISQLKTRLRFLDDRDSAIELSRPPPPAKEDIINREFETKLFSTSRSKSTQEPPAHRPVATNFMRENTDQNAFKVIKIARSAWMNREPSKVPVAHRHKFAEPANTKRYFTYELPPPPTTTEAATTLRGPKIEKRIKPPIQTEISSRRHRSSLKRRLPVEEELEEERLEFDNQDISRDEYYHGLNLASKGTSLADNTSNETSALGSRSRKVLGSSRSTSQGGDSCPLQIPRHLSMPGFQLPRKLLSHGQSSVDSTLSPSEDLPVPESHDLLLTTVGDHPSNHPSRTSHRAHPLVPQSHFRKTYPTQTPTPSLPQPISVIRECVEKESVI